MSIQRKSMLAVLVLPLVLSACASGNTQGFLAVFRAPQIAWNDTSWCVPLELKIALNKISRKFGPIKVHSTHRWPLENARKGGKKRSYHLTCRAVDFSVPGDPREVKAYIRSLWEVGGYSYYPGGFYHIDNGPRRTW
ncbi:MAG: D-Ala-D-Ala carboxypeptidase family metallohydrolase [Pseudomonadota bacterium]